MHNPVRTKKHFKSFRPQQPRTNQHSAYFAFLSKQAKNISLDSIEPFSQLDYPEELKIKSDALKEFLLNFKIPVVPEPVIPSPLFRAYRTTSKRRVLARNNHYSLLFADMFSHEQHPHLSKSKLEAPGHALIYETVHQCLNKDPKFVFLGNNLNYVIIKGSYQEFSVIFNLIEINSRLLSAVEKMTEILNKTSVKIRSVFVYYDPQESDYYLDDRDTGKDHRFKKIFGSQVTYLKIGTLKYSYHPMSFSQINESILPVFLDTIYQSIARKEKYLQVIDLFCGYGLFSIYCSSLFKTVYGMDSNELSIKHAIVNSQYVPNKMRFYPKSVTLHNLETCLPVTADSEGEVIILDPPRNGTAEECIEYLATRNPLKVVHVFCGIDNIPHEIGRWNASGYKINKIIPVDMFAGTAGLEVVFILSPAVEQP
jgi:tRNA/tmRNA/rRNA uracil-C5-methylase (TrmA/RlmC/RlmD family)